MTKPSQQISEKIRAAILHSGDNVIETTTRLFALGYKLDEQGARVEAEHVYRSVIDVLEIVRSERGSRLSDSAFAQCAFNHGMSLARLGRFHQARLAFKQAAEVYERQLQQGGNGVLAEAFAESLRFLAVMQQRCGDHGHAAQSFLRVIGLYRSLIALSPKRTREFTSRLKSSVLCYKKSAARCRPSVAN